MGGGHGVLELFGLRGPVGFRTFSDDVDGSEDAKDAERVGEGIAEDKEGGLVGLRRGAQGFLHRGEGRGIGDSTGKGAEGEPGGLAGELDPEKSKGGTADHHQKGGHVHSPAVLLKNGREGGAQLVADGVDEEDEAEIAEKVEGLGIDLQVESGKNDAREKDAGHAEPESADFNFPDPEAEGDQTAESEKVEG